MLNQCFYGKPNTPKNAPKKTLITSRSSNNGFEARAFNCLFSSKSILGIKSVYKCSAARMDGCLEMEDGEIILLEMKETLNWTSVKSATFQFLAGNSMLNLRVKRAIIVFENLSKEWEESFKHEQGTWGSLALHSKEVSEHITIGALRINKDNSLEFPK
jgi:hypothetical protein